MDMDWCHDSRLPEELVMDLLQRMVLTNTITDDRLAAFFTHARVVLTLQGCSSIRNSILRQIPIRCPQLVRVLRVPRTPRGGL
jgi:hypothetical protein